MLYLFFFFDYSFLFTQINSYSYSKMGLSYFRDGILLSYIQSTNIKNSLYYKRDRKKFIIYSDEETLDDDKTKYLFEKKVNNINDNSTDDNNDLDKVEEIMRNSKDNEE